MRLLQSVRRLSRAFELILILGNVETALAAIGEAGAGLTVHGQRSQLAAGSSDVHAAVEGATCTRYACAHQVVRSLSTKLECVVDLRVARVAIGKRRIGICACLLIEQILVVTIIWRNHSLGNKASAHKRDVLAIETLKFLGIDLQHFIDCVVGFRLCLFGSATSAQQ